MDPEGPSGDISAPSAVTVPLVSTHTLSKREKTEKWLTNILAKEYFQSVLQNEPA